MSLERLDRAMRALSDAVDRKDKLKDPVDALGHALTLVAAERTTVPPRLIFTMDESTLVRDLEGVTGERRIAAHAAVDVALLIADLRYSGEYECAEALAGSWLTASQTILGREVAAR